jgi:hypothetical protein
MVDATAPSIASLAITVNEQNQPHIAYTDAVKRTVKHAVRVGGKWQVETVARVGRSVPGDRSGIAVRDGIPYLSFYDSGAGALKVAFLRANQWVAETVDENSAGFSSSLQLDGNTVWVTYAAENYGLKVASRQLRRGELALHAQPAGTNAGVTGKVP